MSEHPTFGEFVLGLEGLAILRSWMTDPATVKARSKMIAEIVRQLEKPPWSNAIEGMERTTITGYAEWATTYDNSSSPPILAEQPIVRSLITNHPVGKALDAACGTGRHAEYLASLGHRVTGIDATSEMLEVARAKVPGAKFELAELDSIPLPDDAIDLAVCSLSLTHCPNLIPPITELSRVIRPGGTLIISDVHPFLIMLGAHADYQLGQTTTRFVRNHAHQVSAYLSAFQEAGLNIVQCIEPLYGDQEISAGNLGRQIEDLHLDGLMEVAEKGIPIVIIWELQKGA